MMYEEFTRKMNEQEIVDLEQYLISQSHSATYAILTHAAVALFWCLLVLIVCAAGIAALNQNQGVIVSLLWLCPLGILGVLWTCKRIGDISREILLKKTHNTQVQAALTEGTVDIRRFVAEDVINFTQ